MLTCFSFVGGDMSVEQEERGCLVVLLSTSSATMLVGGPDFSIAVLSEYNPDTEPFIALSMELICASFRVRADNESANRKFVYDRVSIIPRNHTVVC